jgi:hypothetical protein
MVRISSLGSFRLPDFYCYVHVPSLPVPSWLSQYDQSISIRDMFLI